MSDPLPYQAYDPDTERTYFWESPLSERDIHLRISLRELSQAIARTEPRQMMESTKGALHTLGSVCRSSGYSALACMCSEMLEQVEDAEAGFADHRSRDLFRRWLSHVEDYLSSNLSRQSLSAIINMHRQIWSYALLSRTDRVLLVRALRRGGR